MKTIYKYSLTTKPQQEVKMPGGAEILSVQVQDKVPCVWALVNPTQRLVTRHLEVYCTGEPISEAMLGQRKFLGTVHLEGGKLVLHVFERF